jgi:hypothetical protein
MLDTSLLQEIEANLQSRIDTLKSMEQWWTRVRNEVRQLTTDQAQLTACTPAQLQTLRTHWQNMQRELNTRSEALGGPITVSCLSSSLCNTLGYVQKINDSNSLLCRRCLVPRKLPSVLREWTIMHSALTSFWRLREKPKLLLCWQLLIVLSRCHWMMRHNVACF